MDLSWSSVFIEYGEDIYICDEYESNCRSYEDVFDCNLNVADCQPNSEDFGKNVIDCDYESITFDSRARPPQNISSCIYEYVFTNDGYADSFAIVDNENNIWFWQNTILLFMREIGLAIMPTFGILVGLALGVLINLYRRYLRPFIKRRNLANRIQ